MPFFCTDDMEEDGDDVNGDDGRRCDRGGSSHRCQDADGSVAGEDDDVDMEHASIVTSANIFLTPRADPCRRYVLPVQTRGHYTRPCRSLCHCCALHLCSSYLGQEPSRSVIAVRLDLFHGLQRISRLVKKTHGAFRPFMARLRDACFIVNQEDIAEASYVRFGGLFPRYIRTVFKKQMENIT